MWVIERLFRCSLYGAAKWRIVRLTWDKVNLEQRQILVNCSWSQKDGLKSTKSGHDRIVEIPNTLLPLLRELKLQSAESDFVLPRLNRWDRGEQAYDLRLFLKAIGLHEIRFHDLRASWATLLLNKGVAPSQVMSMGGWADLGTMMIYMRKAGIDIRNTTCAGRNADSRPATSPSHCNESGSTWNMKSLTICSE